MMENEAPQVVVVEAEKIDLVIESASVTAITRSEPVAPITHEELTAKLEQLSARARAAGISPLQQMISSYARRGMTIIDTFLSALEDGSSTKKPSDTEAKAPDAAKKEG